MANQNRSVLNSVCTMKCPRCRQGELYATGTFSFDKPFEMLDRCSECNQSYMPEPGFYWGAMYISYSLFSGISLALVLPLVFFFDWTINQSLALLFFIGVISFIWLFRVSRSIWIHIFVRYQPNKIHEKPSQVSTK